MYFFADAERAKRDAAARVVDAHLAGDARQDRALEVLINDTLYHEQRRLERESKRDPVVRADKAFYRGVRRPLGKASSNDLRALFGTITARFADAENGRKVLLWARRRELCDEINRSRRNQSYLPDVDLPPLLEATADLERIAKSAKFVLMVMPWP